MFNQSPNLLIQRTKCYYINYAPMVHIPIHVIVKFIMIHVIKHSPI